MQFVTKDVLNSLIIVL